MDKLIDEVFAEVNHVHDWSRRDQDEIFADVGKLLREVRTSMQSLIDGDPNLDPSELVEKHREWFRELLA